MRYADHRYAVLFYMLVASLIASPLVQALGLPGAVIEFLLAANLVAAVLAFREARLRRIVLLVLVLALAARPGAAWLGVEGVVSASLVLWAVLALLAAANGLRFALRGRAVGREQIYAALGAYLLVGFFFGLLYWVLEARVPGSLAAAAETAGSFSVETTIYFSFVTLASLGYGDVLPVSDPARGLAVLEVVGGQLYLAVLVARLVSAWR